ncbi:MAG: tetratricopeptide repeat protein [Chloroflexi bacterium]|nr:tetratricopeptide repeat protein [Chloroflexota bacterium]
MQNDPIDSRILLSASLVLYDVGERTKVDDNLRTLVNLVTSGESPLDTLNCLMLLTIRARLFGEFPDFVPPLETIPSPNWEGQTIPFHPVLKGWIGLWHEVTSTERSELIGYVRSTNLKLFQAGTSLSWLANIARLDGNTDDAIRMHDEARLFSRERGAKTEAAYSAFELADTLLEHDDTGDRAKATELQEEAIIIATELGLEPLLERVLAQRSA